MADTVIVVITLLTLALILGATVVILIAVAMRRKGDDAPVKIEAEMVAERVRAVGKLVGLEVHAKEIATSTKGWGWLPPILLSQAKLAMIFHFEKQYAIELGAMGPGDVTEISPGRFRVTLPAVEGQLRLTDVTPYDVQSGRVLGLLDVIQMNATTQRQLIKAAQEQAADLFTSTEARYISEAKRSIERHMGSLMQLVGVEADFAWKDQATAREEPVSLELAGVGSA